MKVYVTQESIESTNADTIIVNLFEGVTTPAGATGVIDRALDGAIAELIENGDLTGKDGEVGVVYPRGKLTAKRVLVTGLGKAGKLDAEQIRKSAGNAAKKARQLNAKHVTSIVHGAGIGNVEVHHAAHATIEGSLLALYAYNAQKLEETEGNTIESCTIVELNSAKIPVIQRAIKNAESVVTGVTIARDLVNAPPNVATPAHLAEAASTIAYDHNLEITVGDRNWAAEHSMGAFLAVAKGAGEDPKFIVLEYNSERTDLATYVLVGKGITFDTGGISIKPSKGLAGLKADMAGGAAVLGAMKSIALDKLPLRVVGIVPSTENMPDALAYRPADVITASNGKTIEIINTDAEGRMVLADALVYAKRYHPTAVIDLATLTGSCVVALGSNMAGGLFTGSDNLRNDLVAAGDATRERVWPLPLWEEYKDAIKSDVADIKNCGDATSGVASSAVFLQEFTDYPWAHIDMAGMSVVAKDTPYTPKGATGYGVRLLVEFLRTLSSKSEKPD